MTEIQLLASALFALLLSWMCGAVWVRYVLARAGRQLWSLVLCYGFFLGLFITTLLMRLWSAAGFEITLAAIALALLGLAIVGFGLNVMQRGPARVCPLRPPLPVSQRVVIAVLLALVAWRYQLMLQELLLRPLFPWDAFMNWAPKAVVWFHLGELVEFVRPNDWIAQSGNELYTLGNWRAWSYPITLPLIQLWSMLAVGTWDSSIVYLTWLVVPLAMALGIYGHLRLSGVGQLPSVIACYLLLNLPYMNVHTVLAGYADIWLAGAFALAVFALGAWRSTGQRAFLLLSLAMCCLCAQLKLPGVLLALVVLLCFLWVCCRSHVRNGLVPGVALAVATIAGVIALKIGFTLPGLGEFYLGNGVLRAGWLGRISLGYFPEVWDVVFESLFVMLNWNLLAYAAVAAALWMVSLRLFSRCYVGVETAALIMATLLLLAIFLFSSYHESALNYTTLNRALLYLMPLLTGCLFLPLGSNAQPAATSGKG